MPGENKINRFNAEALLPALRGEHDGGSSILLRPGALLLCWKRRTATQWSPDIGDGTRGEHPMD